MYSFFSNINHSSITVMYVTVYRCGRAGRVVLLALLRLYQGSTEMAQVSTRALPGSTIDKQGSTESHIIDE